MTELKKVLLLMGMPYEDSDESDWSIYSNNEITFEDDAKAVVSGQSMIVSGHRNIKTISGKNTRPVLGVFSVSSWEEYGQTIFEFDPQSVCYTVPEAAGWVAKINVEFEATQLTYDVI